jgi:hypothetical protein
VGSKPGPAFVSSENMSDFIVLCLVSPSIDLPQNKLLSHNWSNGKENT